MTGRTLLSLVAVVGGVSGPLCAEATTTTTIDITTSNVATDLTALYGANLKDVVPSKAHGDLYDDFKYLTALSRAGEMYFYVYFESPIALSEAKLTYSDSKVLSNEGGYSENEKSASLTLLNTWGKEKVFYKFKCDQLYSYNPTATDGSQTHRFRAITFTGLDSSGNALTKYAGVDYRGCEITKGGYIWNDEAENADQVYDYYKDNYIVIGKDSLCQSQLCASKDSGNKWYQIGAGAPYTTEISEYHWLFFNVKDYHVSGYDQFDLKYLIGAKLRYQPCTYDMVYDISERADFVKGTLPIIYSGVYLAANGAPATDQLDTFLSTVKASTGSNSNPRYARFENVKYGSSVVKTLTESDLTSEVKVTDSGSFPVSNIPGIPQGNWNVNYKYNRVYKMDTSSIDAIADDDEHEPIKRYLSDKAGKFEWAINFDKTSRSMTDANEWNNPVDWWWGQSKITTKCTDIVDAQFTTLTFSNGYMSADLNAIMEPVSTSEAVTSPTMRVTYSSALTESISNLLSFLWNTFSIGAKALSILVVVAIGLIVVYLVFTAIMKIRGSSLAIPKKK